MTSATSEKILVLRGTSAISLDDRFSELLRASLPQVEVSCDMSLLQHRQEASHFNRSLAQQMESRPSVRAALQNKGLKQRLGRSNVQARLGRPAWTRRFRGRTVPFGRMGFRYRRGFPVAWAWKPRRSPFQWTISATKSSGRLPWGLEMRGGRAASTGALAGSTHRKGLRQRGTVPSNKVWCGPSPAGGGLNQRMVGSRGWARNTQNITKEELDEQLDDYMSTSRSRLDAELDAYMALTADKPFN